LHYLADMPHEGLILDREAIENELRRRGPGGLVPDEHSFLNMIF
jgi:hypothetical protein